MTVTLEMWWVEKLCVQCKRVRHHQIMVINGEGKITCETCGQITTKETIAQAQAAGA